MNNRCNTHLGRFEIFHNKLCKEDAKKITGHASIYESHVIEWKRRVPSKVRNGGNVINFLDFFDNNIDDGSIAGCCSHNSDWMDNT